MDDFNLSDFLNAGAGVYTGIVNANATTDAAKINQQTAALTAATAAQNAAASAQTKTYIVYGVLGLFGLLIVAFVIKKLK